MRGSRTTATHRDHPRIRGEHYVCRRCRKCNPGSSPHTRGAPSTGLVMTIEIGIIPAYAGSTLRGSRTTATHRDHPRIRGEHYVCRRCRKCNPGSSPHTRGAPSTGLVMTIEIGIIPAYAGSTLRGSRTTATRRDHPRIRGEHRSVVFLILDGSGSSPHTRGARILAEVVDGEHGIIPAYAGSTRPACRSTPARGDHPRIRGEHLVCGVTEPGLQGSSPHTRGALNSWTRTHAGSGIIPAYAGSTPRFDYIYFERWDHPRIRGEHFRVF